VNDNIVYYIINEWNCILFSPLFLRVSYKTGRIVNLFILLRYSTIRNRIADAESPVPILKLRLELQTRFGLHRRRRRRRINREEGVMLRYYTAERVQRLSISILRRWRTHTHKNGQEKENDCDVYILYTVEK